MAIRKTYGPEAPLAGGYAYKVGTDVGSKENYLKSLAAAQSQSQFIAQLQQRNQLANQQLQQHALDRQYDLARNAADNQSAMDRQTLAADLEQRNWAMQNMLPDVAVMEAPAVIGGGQQGVYPQALDWQDLAAGMQQESPDEPPQLTVPDVTRGPLQNYAASLDNMSMFRLAAAQERENLLTKLGAASGSQRQALLTTALQKGWVAHTPDQHKRIKELERGLSELNSPTYAANPQAKIAMQAQIASELQRIKANPAVVPPDKQPAGIDQILQENTSFITLDDETRIGVFVDPATKRSTLLTPSVIGKVSELEQFKSRESFIAGLHTLQIDNRDSEGIVEGKRFLNENEIQDRINQYDAVMTGKNPAATTTPQRGLIGQLIDRFVGRSPAAAPTAAAVVPDVAPPTAATQTKDVPIDPAVTVPLYPASPILRIAGLVPPDADPNQPIVVTGAQLAKWGAFVKDENGNPRFVGTPEFRKKNLERLTAPDMGIGKGTPIDPLDVGELAAAERMADELPIGTVLRYRHNGQIYEAKVE